MLGNGSTADSPNPVTALLPAPATSVSIGTNHACASIATGVSCWGGGSEGELGDGTYDPHPTPVAAVFLPAEIVPRFGEVAETDAPGTTTLLARVELSVAADHQVSVDWATTAGSNPWDATPGVDYQPASGTLTFAPGERIRYAPVTVLGDDLDEGDETIHFVLSNPVGAPLSADLFGAQGVIRDDEPTPTVLPGVGTLSEGEAGTSVLRVPLTLTGASASEVTVPWSTLQVVGAPAGQADAGVDYTATSGTVTIAPGTTTAWIEITVHADATVEPDEYVVVSFIHPTNAVMGGFWGLGFGVIQNDD
jgi:chitinase